MLSRKEMEFILDLFERKKTNKKNKMDMSLPSFYMMVWGLRDKKLLASDGIDDRNRKIWKLNKRGREIAERLREIREILNA